VQTAAESSNAGPSNTTATSGKQNSQALSYTAQTSVALTFAAQTFEARNYATQTYAAPTSKAHDSTR
jgi:hypothetical protein